MGDMLQTGSDWLAQQQREHVSQPVHYQRASASIEVPATRGRRQFQTSDGEGATIVVNTEDFIVAVDDLVIDGVPATPDVGDRIVVGDLEDGLVFEVMNQNGISPFEFADSYRTRFRIHTLYVGHQPPQP